MIAVRRDEENVFPAWRKRLAHCLRLILQSNSTALERQSWALFGRDKIYWR